MKIHPTPDQQAFIRHAIDAGRIARPEDAAMQAMALWEEHERRRLEILSHVDNADASLSRGESITITQASMRQLASEVNSAGATVSRRRMPPSSNDARSCPGRRRRT